MCKINYISIFTKLLYLQSFRFLIFQEVSASPPLFPEADTGLGFLDKIYDARRPIIKPQKHTSRANRTIEVKHYFLSNKIILNDAEEGETPFTAPSTIKILFSCIQTTNTLLLNAYMKDSIVTIQKESIKIINQDTLEDIPVAGESYDESTENYQLSLAIPLEQGNDYMIFMKYTSTILDPENYLDGLYYSYYTENDEKKYVAVTQFESEGARKMFPCIDQPDDKAYFTISIGRMKKYNSLSNMQIVKTEPMNGSPGWEWDHFAATPIMSTYLLAVVVSEYDCSTAPSHLFNGKDVKVCAPKTEIARGGGVYGAETAAKLLKFYEIYLGYEYPLPKMYSTSLTHFAAGAMENWGLNTYRTSALLYYPNETTEAQREGITSVIAHELGHQWFGNLVTCKSWNQIWLNEGFATYIQYIGVNEVAPEFGPHLSWYTDAFQRALLADQKTKSHPIVNNTENYGHFDVITYQKGASLIHMLEHFITPETFLSGLKKYLRQHAFDNTDQWDLFSTLEEEALVKGTHPGINLTDIMDSWTLQAGYPVLSINKASKTGYYISQTRYLTGDSQKRSEDENEVNSVEHGKSWWVNIHPVTDYDPDFTYRRSTVWLAPSYSTLLWTAKKESNWMVLNTGSVFGRVWYDNEISSNIAKQLNQDYNVIGAKNRAQLMDDYFSFAFNKQYNVTIGHALQFTEYLANEHEKIVWLSLMSRIRKAYYILSSSEESFALFKNYFLPRFAGGLNNINFGSDRGRNAVLKVNFLHWLVALDHKETLDYASKLVKDWMNQTDLNQNNIPVDFRSIYYCGAVANGNKETFNFIWERSQEMDKENHNLLSSLACASKAELITSLLEKLIDPNSGLTTYKASLIVRKLAENTIARKMTFEFLQTHFEKIHTQFKDLNVFAAFITTVARAWSQPEELQRLHDFSEKYSDKLEPMENVLTNSKQTIEDNMQWMNSFKHEMDTWFQTSLNIKK